MGRFGVFRSRSSAIFGRSSVCSKNPARTRFLGLEVPTGLLLIGPPGTWKTLTAGLIASQTNRSFYPLTAALF